MISALLLLATLFFLQAKIPLAFLAMIPLAFLATWTYTGSACFKPVPPSPFLPNSFQVTQAFRAASSCCNMSGKTWHPIEPLECVLGTLMESVQFPLQSLPTLEQINTPTQLSIVCRFTRVQSLPTSRSSIKVLDTTSPKTKPWGTPLETGCQLD